mmetsp:Transcript_3447/g.11539  ORF Transcript_3447/g.11539 Transcript_3447/m.11539 type:complete len:258 (+) Transcript_3447:1983-2756(+)
MYSLTKSDGCFDNRGPIISSRMLSSHAPLLFLSTHKITCIVPFSTTKLSFVISQPFAAHHRRICAASLAGGFKTNRITPCRTPSSAKPPSVNIRVIVFPPTPAMTTISTRSLGSIAANPSPSRNATRALTAASPTTSPPRRTFCLATTSSSSDLSIAITFSTSSRSHIPSASNACPQHTSATTTPPPAPPPAKPPPPTPANANVASASNRDDHAHDAARGASPTPGFTGASGVPRTLNHRRVSRCGTRPGRSGAAHA